MSAGDNEIIINKETKYYWKHRDELNRKRQAKRMEDPDYVAKYEERMKRKAEREVLQKEREERKKKRLEEKAQKEALELEKKASRVEKKGIIKIVEENTEKKEKREKKRAIIAKILEEDSSGDKK
jgi:hypothetical protein